MQAAKSSPMAAAIIVKGADVSTCGTKLAKQAMADNDDVLLGALVLKVKSSVLDTLDLDYKRLCAASFPHAAAQYLVRTQPDIGAISCQMMQVRPPDLFAGLRDVVSHPQSVSMRSSLRSPQALSHLCVGQVCNLWGIFGSVQRFARDGGTT